MKDLESLEQQYHAPTEYEWPFILYSREEDKRYPWPKQGFECQEFAELEGDENLDACQLSEPT